MITAKIINRINFPEIKLQSTLEEIADRIIIQDIKNGIAIQRAIDGGALPENEPKTRLRKGGRPALDDTGELKNSFSSRTSGKDKVIISIDTGRRDIAGYLQIDGIRTTRGIKHYRFFGISKDAYTRSMAYVKNKIKELTKSK
jgi:hypothetical protein